MAEITERTRNNLRGVHPDLEALWMTTPLPYPCQVIDGLRTFPEQERMYKAGSSKTLNSRHLTGHAIDFAIWLDGIDGNVSWEKAKYKECVKAFKSTAKTLGTPITCGADWGWDYGHLELSWPEYPIEQKARPKTASNSKTIAAAVTGVPVVTFAEEIFLSIKSVTGNLLAEIDSTTVGIVQATALTAIVLFIVWERYKKIKRDGV